MDLKLILGLLLVVVFSLVVFYVFRLLRSKGNGINLNSYLNNPDHEATNQKTCRANRSLPKDPDQ